MKLYKGFLLANALFVNTTVALAGGFTAPNVVLPSAVLESNEIAAPYFELGLMGGIAALAAGDSRLHITDSEIDKLVPNNNEWNSWSAGVGVGYVIPLFGATEHSKDLQWFSAIKPELNLYYLNGDIHGDVYRFESHDFNQADYTMDFRSTRLMFDLALTVASWRDLSFYVLGGVGPSWNHVGFKSHIDDDVECDLADVDVNSHSDTNVAYELGAGLTYQLSEHANIFVEYLYADFQDLKLGNSADVADLNPSDFNINSQAVFLGIRYMF